MRVYVAWVLLQCMLPSGAFGASNSRGAGKGEIGSNEQSGVSGPGMMGLLNKAIQDPSSPNNVADHDPGLRWGSLEEGVRPERAKGKQGAFLGKRHAALPVVLSWWLLDSITVKAVGLVYFERGWVYEVSIDHGAGCAACGDW